MSAPLLKIVISIYILILFYIIIISYRKLYNYVVITMQYSGINIRYTPKWSAYNEAQKREKSLFMELLVDLCVGVEEGGTRSGSPGIA